MKKLVSLLVLLVMVSFPFYLSDSKAYAMTRENVQIYEVKENDSYLDIALKYGVSENKLKKINDKEKVTAEEKIIIPKGFTGEEKDLLARLIHAEAKGEPQEGKIAVGQVVLNRMESEEFPDTLKEVIYEERQFESVDNGMIQEPAGKESIKAVDQAIALHGQGNDSLYFFNPAQTDSKWLRAQTFTAEIGNHRFAK